VSARAASCTSVVQRQRGVSLIGVLVVGACIVFFALLGFRTVPALTEYLAVQRVVGVVAQEANDGASQLEVRRSFDRRAQIDGISSVRGSDLEIFRQSGRVIVEVSYERAVPVVGNMSLLFDFHVSTLD